jgi:hypothetical protein
MKLAEAAHVLGISLEDVTIDILNKTYKKLVMTWDPEKVLCMLFLTDAALDLTIAVVY